MLKYSFQMLKYSFQIKIILLLTLYPANAKGADAVIQCPYPSYSTAYSIDDSPDRVSSSASKIYNIIVNDDTIGFADMLNGVDNLRPEYVKKVGISKIFSSEILDAIKEKFLTCYYNQRINWRPYPHILRIPYGLHYTLSRKDYDGLNDTLSIMFHYDGNIVSINDSGNGYTPEPPLPIPADGAWETSKGVVHPACLWEGPDYVRSVGQSNVEDIVAQYNKKRGNWPKIPEDANFWREPGYYLGFLNSLTTEETTKLYIENMIRIADERCFSDYWENRIAEDFYIGDDGEYFRREYLRESNRILRSSYRQGTSGQIVYGWGTDETIETIEDTIIYKRYKVAYKPSLEACTYFEPYIGGQCKDVVVLDYLISKGRPFRGSVPNSWNEYVLYGLFLIKDKEYIIPLRMLHDVNGLRSFIESLEK